jgi:REP element-mobilizing transposase RayT
MLGDAARKLNRHRNFNYSLPGSYYVTICTDRHINWFGHIANNQVMLNNYGQMAYNLFQNLPHFYPNITIDCFIIMPNHIHGIICIQQNVGTGLCPVLNDVGTGQRPVPTIMKKYGLLSKIINGYKNFLIKTIRQQYNNYQFQWQRSFYDRVLRNQNELEHARWYIKNNPGKHSLAGDKFKSRI